MKFSPLLFFIAVLATTPVDASAQSSSLTSPRQDDGIAVGVGYSWVSPTYWGIIRDRRVAMFDLAYETQIVGGREWSLVHAVEVPVALVARASSSGSWACWPRHPHAPCVRDSSVAMSAGVGVLPFSFKLLTGAPGGRRVFAHAAGGASVFSSNMPTVHARRFNFMAEAGAGIELPPVNGRAWALGFKYVHMSNGDTAPSNPGLDASVVYLRLAWRRGSAMRGGGDATEAPAPASAPR